MKSDGKTINGVPVSDDIFYRMSFLQERLRRIDAEMRELALQRSVTEQEVAGLLGSIDQNLDSR